MKDGDEVNNIVRELQHLELLDYKCDEATRHIVDSSENEWNMSLNLPDINIPMRNFLGITVDKEAVLQLLNSSRKYLQAQKSEFKKELSER